MVAATTTVTTTTTAPPPPTTKTSDPAADPPPPPPPLSTQQPHKSSPMSQYTATDSLPSLFLNDDEEEEDDSGDDSGGVAAAAAAAGRTAGTTGGAPVHIVFPDDDAPPTAGLEDGEDYHFSGEEDPFVQPDAPLLHVRQPSLSSSMTIDRNYGRADFVEVSEASQSVGGDSGMVLDIPQSPSMVSGITMPFPEPTPKAKEEPWWQTLPPPPPPTDTPQSTPSLLGAAFVPTPATTATKREEEEEGGGDGHEVELSSGPQEELVRELPREDPHELPQKDKEEEEEDLVISEPKKELLQVIVSGDGHAGRNAVSGSDKNLPASSSVAATASNRSLQSSGSIPSSKRRVRQVLQQRPSLGHLRRNVTVRSSPLSAVPERTPSMFDLYGSGLPSEELDSTASSGPHNYDDEYEEDDDDSDVDYDEDDDYFSVDDAGMGKHQQQQARARSASQGPDLLMDATSGQDGEYVGVTLKTLAQHNRPNEYALSLQCERGATTLLLGRTIPMADFGTLSLSSRGGDAGRGGPNGGARPGKGGRVVVKVEERDAYLLMAVEDCCRPAVEDYPTSLTKLWPAMLDRVKGGKGSLTGDVREDGTFEIQLQSASEESVSTFVSRYDLKLQSFVYQQSPHGGGNGGVDSSFLSEGMGHHPGPPQKPFFQFGEVAYVSNILLSNIGPMPSPSFQRSLLEIVDGNDKGDEEEPKFCHVQPRPASGRAFLQEAVGPNQTATATGRLAFGIRLPPPADLLRRHDYDPIRREETLTLRAIQLGPEKASGEDDSPWAVRPPFSDFRRCFENFHVPKPDPRKVDLSQIQLGFPVENYSGLDGLSSLSAADDTTLLKFNVCNTGRSDLGSASRHGRIVAVRFHVHTPPALTPPRKGRKKKSPYDICADQVRILDPPTPGTQRRMLDGHSHVVQRLYGDHVVDVRSPEHAILVDVPHLSAACSTEVRQCLRFTSAVRPYQRTAVQADVLLQDFDTVEKAAAKKVVSVIQRRKLEICCEPRYLPNIHRKVVLVTSCATTREQYNAWMSDVMSERFGWTEEVECFSVSRYGHLDPHRDVEGCVDARGNPRKLKQLFANKLVVVLDDEFSPQPKSEMMIRPSRLVPSGCVLSQASGFDASTRWLLVRGGGGHATTAQPPSDATKRTTIQGASKLLEWLGSSYGSAEHEMLSSLLRVEPDVTFEESGIAQYKKWLTNIMRKERSSGAYQHNALRCDTVSVECQSLKRPSEGYVQERIKKLRTSLASWISKMDPMRQYIIEYTTAAMTERLRGGGGRMSPYPLWRIGTLYIRRGCCHAHNGVVTIKATSSLPWSASHRPRDRSIRLTRQVCSRPVLLGVVSALSAEARVALFCRTLMGKFNQERSDAVLDDTLEVLKDALASEFLWEVTNVRNGRMALAAAPAPHDAEESGDPGCGIAHHFPTIEALLSHYSVVDMVRQSFFTSQLAAVVMPHASDLVARLECIAESMEIRSSRLSTSPTPSSSSAGESHDAGSGGGGGGGKGLQGMMGMLRESWKTVLNDAVLEKKREDVVAQTKRMVKIKAALQSSSTSSSSGGGGGTGATSSHTTASVTSTTTSSVSAYCRRGISVLGRKRRWRDGLRAVFSSQNVEKYGAREDGPSAFDVRVERYVQAAGGGAPDDEEEEEEAAADEDKQSAASEEALTTTNSNTSSSSKVRFGKVVCLSLEQGNVLRQEDKLRRDEAECVRRVITTTREEFHLGRGTQYNDENKTLASI